MRDFQIPNRSPAYGTRAMAATSHPLATQAALDAIREGGNAIDGALAAVALLCVVEPHQTGIGGDAFALIAEPDGTLHGLNGSGRSPVAADADAIAVQGLDAIPATSGHAVTVPGAVRAWETLAARGHLGLERLLAPAVAAARDGFVVTPRVAYDWAGHLDLFARNPELGARYSRDGAAPRAGDLWRLPDLAETLARIGREGASAFYEGQVADEIVATVSQAGGTLTLDDLAAHDSEWVTPLRRSYRGHEVIELPPATQGLTALQMLGILERFDIGALDPRGAEKFHLEIEAARLAYGVRDRDLADADHMAVPVEDLLGAPYLDRLAAEIDLGRARPIGPPPGANHTDTVYLTVVDGEGRAVSLINSLFTGFGSGLCTPSGVVLQSRGSGFSLAPGHPNRIGPRKRPLHTLIPGLVLEDGLPTLSFGVMGGAYQACGHAHLLTNLIDHGLDVQAGLESPRAFFEGERVMLETTLGAPVADTLRGLGHTVAPSATPIGGGQAIRIDRARGVLIGGSDPRKDGCALGL